MSSEEHSRRAAGGGDRALHQSRSENSFDDVLFDAEFLLPLSLVGLGHLAHDTIYRDAGKKIRQWESLDVKTLLEKIPRLRRSGQAHNIIPRQSAEHTLENALLQYLRHVRDDQLRKCIREHRRLREIDEEVAQLHRKIGLTSNDVTQTLGDADEDNMTFIDDERVSSRSPSNVSVYQTAGDQAPASSL